MKVYLLVEDMGYDGQNTLAIFSIPELAYAWVESRYPKWVKQIDEYSLNKEDKEMYYYDIYSNKWSNSSLYLLEFEIDEEA